jgi:adenosine deaminase CECR1
MYGTDGRETVPHRDWLIAFDRVVNEVKAHFKTLGREDEFFGARVCSTSALSQTLLTFDS